MSCVFVVSHGNLNINKSFIIPKNIRLIQYSKPRGGITLPEAKYIYGKGCVPVDNDLYAIDKETSEIYISSYKKYILEPGTMTNNLELKFTDDFDNDDMKMGIEYIGGEIVIPGKHLEATLEDVLNIISKKYNNLSMVDVVQLSCRSGDYSTNNIDEFVREFEGINITKNNNFKSMDTLPYKVTEKKYYFAESEEEARTYQHFAPGRRPSRHSYMKSRSKKKDKIRAKSRAKARSKAKVTKKSKSNKSSRSKSK